MADRPPLGLAGAIILLALVGGAFVVAAGTAMVTCGGDGGSPYAAPASPRGQYCDAHLPLISILGGLALALAGSIVAFRRRLWWPLVASAIAGALLIASPLMLGAALSKGCGDKRESMTADEFDRYLHERPECAHY
jgi:hypothetical protein